MSKLTSEDISHLSRLARLDLTTEEGNRYAEQLTSVVGYIEELQKVDTTQVVELKGVTGLQNVLAADTPRSEDSLCSVPKEALLSGAPAHEDGYIVVRAVMGEEVTGA